MGSLSGLDYSSIGTGDASRSKKRRVEDGLDEERKRKRRKGRGREPAVRAWISDVSFILFRMRLHSR